MRLPLAGESGFQEFGLPYAADAAITRHVSQFLNQHRRTGIEAGEANAADRPDLILVQRRSHGRQRDSQSNRRFGFGVVQRTTIRGSQQCYRRRRLDLAVAHGAAYYAMVRRGPRCADRRKLGTIVLHASRITATSWIVFDPR